LIGPSSGAARADRRIVAMTFVDALGTGTYLAGSIVFFTQALSLSATDVGLGLSLGAVVGILTSVPVGAIADRFGARWTLVAICAWRACGFACYAVIHGFWAFLILTCLLGVTGKAVMASVRQALVGRSVLPENRVRTMAVTQAMRNVGLGLGSLLAFSIVELGARTSYDFIVLLNAASFIAAGALAVAVREKNFPTQEPKPRGRATAALQNRGYVGLTLLNTVFLFNNSVLVIAMPLWALDHTSAPKAIVPVFLTVNTVLVALLQVRAAEWAKSIALAARSLMISGVLLAVAAALIAVASALPAAEAAGAMILGVIALTGCELLQVPASWQLSYSFAPDESLASYLGLFSVGSSTESAIGPYALTAGVIGAGVIGWGAFGAVICCAAMLIPVIVRRVPVPDDRTTAEAAAGLLGGCHSVSARVHRWSAQDEKDQRRGVMIVAVHREGRTGA
jgi:hypothetical protein